MRESTTDNSVILVADVDMLSDGAAVDVQEMFGRKIVVPSNGNLAFALGMVEQFAAGNELISLRSRATAFISRDVRPQDRSGVVISFPVQASRGALLRLVDDAGKPIEVGSSATLAATGTTVPVGYNGEAFIQDLAPSGNRLTVQRPDGHRCMVVFAYHAKLGDIPTIGPLRCQEPVP